MKRVEVVVGTRPEFIKLAPVVWRLKELEGVEVYVTCTGQHTSLLQTLPEFFGVKIDRNLCVYEEGRLFNLNTVFQDCLEFLSHYWQQERPDLVVVHGDTASACSAALAAFNMEIPVAHVEAGLRTHDCKSPYPEEAYRTMIDSFADLSFAPTRYCYERLCVERPSRKGIFMTGNTIVDSLLWTLDKLGSDGYKPKDYVVWTMHRRESHGEKMAGMVEALCELASRHKFLNWIVPVHPNPRVKEAFEDLRKGGRHPNVFLLEPYSYPEFVRLMRGSRLVVTDSGGIQEEAPTLRVRAALLRDCTERPEAMDSGWVVMAGRDKGNVVSTVEKMLGETELPKTENPFGDGRTSHRIAEVVSWFLGIRRDKPRSFPD